MQLLRILRKNVFFGCYRTYKCLAFQNKLNECRSLLIITSKNRECLSKTLELEVRMKIHMLNLADESNIRQRMRS